MRGSGAQIGFYATLAVSAVLVLGLIHYVAYSVPVEASMGIVQKIFYFHVPAGYGMYIGAGVCALGSAGYLYSGTARADAFARAGAEVAVAMGLALIVSGALWAVKGWGAAWTWDPRLTTSMLSVLLYVAYVVLRAFAGDGESEKKFAAALGILSAANLPIIHYSVQKWGGNHPMVVTGKGGGLGDPAMKIAFASGMIAFTFVSAALIWWRARIALAEARLADVEREALELGIGED